MTSVYYTTLLLEKRLRVDIVVLLEMPTKCEIQRVTRVTFKGKIGDGLTRKGCSSTKVLKALENNTL